MANFTLVVEPSPLFFEGPYTHSVAVPISLRNATRNQVVAFMVKTTRCTNTKSFEVYPTQGFINPEQSVTVTVRLLPRDENQMERLTQRNPEFMVKWIVNEGPVGQSSMTSWPKTMQITRVFTGRLS